MTDAPVVSIFYDPVKGAKWRYEWRWNGRGGSGRTRTWLGAFLRGWRAPARHRRRMRTHQNTLARRASPPRVFGGRP